MEEIKREAKTSAEKESSEIISNGKSELSRIEEEILKKDQYIKEVEDIKSEFDKIKKKVEKENKALIKVKSIYDRLKYITEKYKEYDVFSDKLSELNLTDEENISFDELKPSVELKLHSMDIKDLRKAFSENEKMIKETLQRYEGRYTTKTNATIYKLMVMALKAEQQNILYNLKYEKLEKAVEDVKITTEKYLAIASDGNKSILSTITKFINEIEYLFIKSVEIEYEYYVKKEQQKEEQAMLREQMRQEAEERKQLEQQKKQVL